jgi:uncharacterized protein YfeS
MGSLGDRIIAFLASMPRSAGSSGRQDKGYASGEDLEPLPTAHPHFATHFPDPLYYDRAEEMAPFGSDEGSDTLWVWISRRDELQPTATEMNGPDVDGFIIGAGFALIYLTGQIDEEGKHLVLDALRRTDSYYGTRGIGSTEPTLMIRDLTAFPAGTPLVAMQNVAVLGPHQPHDQPPPGGFLFVGHAKVS